jgi:glycerophosphoryl diester phosphodiesterase
MIQILHRGSFNKEKQNTKESVLKSLPLKYIDGVEIDIRMTKDKKLVLSHNDIVKVKHQLKKISNSNYKSLKLPLLENLLKEIDTKKYILLDLKVETRKKEYEKELMKLLKKYPKNYILISFHSHFLKELKNKYPNYKMSLLKGYLLNKNEELDHLDYIFINELTYQNEAGIWTVNNQKTIEKYKNKNIFIITDNPLKNHVVNQK